MSKNTNTMDDVDRLFQCFKCGISPPQSAFRERKRSRRKLKQESSVQKVSASPATPGLEPPGKMQENAKDAQLSTEGCSSTAVKPNKLARGKQISPVVFYGSPHGVPPKRPLSLLRLLNEIRIDLSEQELSELRKDVWATFPRQEEAMKFAKAHKDVHVFSYQDHFSGQRRFLVSTYKEFWRRYKNLNPKFRHHYEVIQECLPCHLYFDLEFCKRHNAGKDGDEMVDLLISVILEALVEKYSIEGNLDWIVELDSSTEDKFSRHLIIHIPKTAFKDNSHAGAFVAEICSRIASARERDGRFEKLFLSILEIVAFDWLYHQRRERLLSSYLLVVLNCEEDMFMVSLICNLDVDCERLLVCKMELDCVKTLHFDTEVASNSGRYSRASQEFLINACNDVSTTYLMGKSPFPALEKFIESIASTGNVPGKIRCWYWFSEYELIIYSMSRNRYCERIGREHKSNHVMYVVDLRRAIFYQKCYDPDCKGYRSPFRPVPLDCLPDSSSFFDSREKDDGGGGLTTNNLGCQLFNNDEEQVLLYDDEDDIDCCNRDSWWLEASKVADVIENKAEASAITSKENVNDDEDDEWWMAVERTASQAEL
ncbi:hypothetical protein SLA2020_059780 [Shorea laevis]